MYVPKDEERVELLKEYLETNYRSYMPCKGYDYWCMLSDMYNILHDEELGKIRGYSQRNYYFDRETASELDETEIETRLCNEISDGR
jgi:hypothetical protein